MDANACVATFAAAAAAVGMIGLEFIEIANEIATEEDKEKGHGDKDGKDE